MLVAKYLGHAKIDETLNTYSHLFKNKLDACMHFIPILRNTWSVCLRLFLTKQTQRYPSQTSGRKGKRQTTHPPRFFKRRGKNKLFFASATKKRSIRKTIWETAHLHRGRILHPSL